MWGTCGRTWRYCSLAHDQHGGTLLAAPPPMPAVASRWKEFPRHVCTGVLHSAPMGRQSSSSEKSAKMAVQYASETCAQRTAAPKFSSAFQRIIIITKKQLYGSPPGGCSCVQHRAPARAHAPRRATYNGVLAAWRDAAHSSVPRGALTRARRAKHAPAAPGAAPLAGGGAVIAHASRRRARVGARRGGALNRATCVGRYRTREIGGDGDRARGHSAGPGALIIATAARNLTRATRTAPLANRMAWPRAL